MTSSKIYLPEHRTMQDKFGTRVLADKQEELIVHEVLTEEDIAFIASRDMFFLSTLNSRGEPTVSYKGGPVGFIKVIDNELIFPNYDGNGMYHSIGNLIKNSKVGWFFSTMKLRVDCGFKGRQSSRSSQTYKYSRKRSF